MRSDLLDAQACVDWAIAQLPVLQERIIGWRRSAYYSVSIDDNSEIGQRLYRLVDVKPIDPVISAEAGAIIHSIRSSLDVLACTLAARNGHPGSKSTYFPIWKTKADFDAPNVEPGKNVFKKIKRLSQVDQAVIKGLAPYPGGNDPLCTLHELDLTRKHRRLLGLFLRPRGVFFSGMGREDFVLRDLGRFDEKSVVLSTHAAVPDGKITVSFQIALDEAGVSGGMDCTHPIREFARLAQSIIKLFD